LFKGLELANSRFNDFAASNQNFAALGVGPRQLTEIARLSVDFARQNRCILNFSGLKKSFCGESEATFYSELHLAPHAPMPQSEHMAKGYGVGASEEVEFPWKESWLIC